MTKIKLIFAIMNPNPGKKLIIEINDSSINSEQAVKWARYPIRTRFINSGDSLENIIQEYVMPVAEKSDIIALGQKIVSIIQNRVVHKKDIKVGFWAKFLSKFAKKTPYGFSVGNPLKMQLAINMAGLPRIIFAGFCSMVAKFFGISGTFYRVAGHQINQLDGFYGEFFPQYGEMGIYGPVGCDSLCDKLKNKFGFSFFVADINDLGGNILGKSRDLKDKEELLLKILKDNPTGQSDEQTPIIIIRKC